MKNLKKLFVAAIMLVVALTAVVSSTYAWFTMQNEVDVDQMNLSVGTAGLDLQVSLDENTANLGYSVAYQPVGQLIPVTYINALTTIGEATYPAGSFQTTTVLSDKYAYTPAIVINKNTEATAKGYVKYDLYFRSSTALDLEVDLSNLGFSKTGDVDGQVESAVKSIRVMFEMGATKVIYEPWYDATSTYGTGRFFEEEQPYASSAWSYFLDYTAETGSVESQEYTLKTTFENQLYTAQQLLKLADGTTDRKKVDAIGAESATGVYTLEIGQLAANTMTKVTVYIWLEGWDGDAINVASGAAFNTHIIFKGFAQGSGN